MKWVPVPFSIPNELFSLVRATDSASRIKTVEIIYPLILAIVLAECRRSSLIKYFTFKNSITKHQIYYAFCFIEKYWQIFTLFNIFRYSDMIF